MTPPPDPAADPASPDSAEGERERWAVLHDLEDWLETPMLVLSFVWLVLVLIELVWTTSGLFSFLGTVIWIVFIAEFVFRFALAPRKLAFLRQNPITLVALVAPAFRFLRVLRVLRMTRGLRLVQIVGTANRGMAALRASLDRRGLGYILATTAIVILLVAAGMLAFEPAREVAGGFDSYPAALWWTAMLVSTMGSDFWPMTPEGRVLALLLAIWGLAVFGYITASLATFFIGRDAQTAAAGADESAAEIVALRREIAALRDDIRRLTSPGPR